MRVTVCELPNHDRRDFERAWDAVCAHVSEHDSELLLLPEMPFSRWLAATAEVDGERWRQSVAEHEARLAAASSLGRAILCTTRPTGAAADDRFQESVVSAPDGALLGPAHRKCLLPDEPGFYEATWYRRGPRVFAPIDLPGLRVGFLICTELWFHEHARAYGKRGTELLLTPRATELATADKWLAGGRVAAVVAGAFSLSSNLTGYADPERAWGGLGWIIDPDGQVLATTSRDRPVVTVDIDLTHAHAARTTYPRYVQEE